MSKTRENREIPPGPRRFEILFKSRAARDLEDLPTGVRRRIDAKIMPLSDDPRPPGVKKLEGLEDLYRIRAGDYRIVYIIEDERRIVLGIANGNRRDVYRSL